MSASEQRVDHYPRASALAREFPILRDAQGIDPFDAEAFAKWAQKAGSTAKQQAAAFVLQVFNFGAKYGRLPPFNAVRAMAVWDPAQRAVFQRWAANPWNL